MVGEGRVLVGEGRLMVGEGKLTVGERKNMVCRDERREHEVYSVVGRGGKESVCE